MDNNLKHIFIEASTVVGGVLLLFGAAVKITGWEYAAWLFSAGALFFAAAQMADGYTGTDPIMKRLRFQQVAGAVFIVITAILMYTDGYHLRLAAGLAAPTNDTLRSFMLAVTTRNSWIFTLTIAAVFELYSILRMDKRQSQLDGK